ncbi:hypothetical protein HPB51_009481 [Rhipicephalus microplus]|uniref:Uncharacterized protein n=1 Tax=Rhipicephalus microplus TaxID=6941 RepID=A0A9J6DTM0_RHIMP|nr:hypothetical protein HPB51_009481 [Rhipicephalus microplus]
MPQKNRVCRLNDAHFATGCLWGRVELRVGCAINGAHVSCCSQTRFSQSQSGEWGSGSGKGGGTGGSVREAGGAFGKMEAAREEEYFRKLVSSSDSNKELLHAPCTLHSHAQVVKGTR